MEQHYSFVVVFLNVKGIVRVFSSVCFWLGETDAFGQDFYLYLLHWFGTNIKQLAYIFCDGKLPEVHANVANIQNMGASVLSTGAASNKKIFRYANITFFILTLLAHEGASAAVDLRSPLMVWDLFISH